MTLKAAFIFLAPEVDPKKDRQTLITPQVELTAVSVGSYQEVEGVATELVNQEIEAIELCGGFGNKGTARIVDAVAGKYEVYPIICSKCEGQMRIIDFIHDEEVIRKIPKHLNLWDVKRKLPPRAHAPPIDFHTTYDEPQMPDVDDQVIDIEYPVEAYF